MDFLQWIDINWEHICGWTAGLYLLYRLSLVLTGFVAFLLSSSNRIKNSEATLEQVSSTLSVVMTNHLPHMQAELERQTLVMEKQTKVLEELHQDFRYVLREGHAK